MIIGITGTLGAGKGTLVEILKKEFGFRHFSVRDFLVKEITKRGLTLSRDTMTDVANDLRKNYGSSYILESLYKLAKEEGGNIVLESIRAMKEAEFVKEKGGIIFAVDADPRLRYERIIKRGSETDKVSFEKFLEDEQREMNSVDDSKQNIQVVMNMADYKFLNNDTKEKFALDVKEILSKII